MSGLRTRLKEMLESARVARSDQDDVLICANEAVTNAIRHGTSRSDQQGYLEVAVEVSAAVLTMSVRDRGGGFHPWKLGLAAVRGLEESGRGLFVMFRLSDGLLFNALPDGTEVVFRKVLSSGANAE